MSTLTAAEDRSVKLVQRRHLFQKVATFSLGDRSIDVVREGYQVTSIPYRDVASVRLAFIGANNCGGEAFPAYACYLRSRHGEKLKLTNLRFEGPGEVSDHSVSYTTFVRCLHQKLLPLRHDVRFVQGSDLYYWMGWVGMAMSLLLLLMLPLLFLADDGGMMLLRKGWVFCLMPLLVSATFLPLIRRGRARPYDPEDLPEEHLPAAEGPGVGE